MLSGASFGLIPLFTLSLFAAGIDTDSVLLYRFTTAALLIGSILLIRKESFRISLSQLLRLTVMGLLYMSSALFLLWGYEYMAAGIATTVHFLYPVCVVILMGLFFGEQISLVNVGAIILAIIGVALLSSGGSSDGHMSVNGMIFVVISALAYGLYIIGLKKLRLGSLSGFTLTFYVMLITAVLFFVKSTIFGSGVMPLKTVQDGVNVVLLALIPTVVSNFALVKCVKLVGSTTASILGALEPLTAVIVGVTIFAEPINATLVIGVILIIGAVATIVVRK